MRKCIYSWCGRVVCIRATIEIFTFIVFSRFTAQVYHLLLEGKKMMRDELTTP